MTSEDFNDQSGQAGKKALEAWCQTFVPCPERFLPEPPYQEDKASLFYEQIMHFQRNNDERKYFDMARESRSGKSNFFLSWPCEDLTKTVKSEECKVGLSPMPNDNSTQSFFHLSTTSKHDYDSPPSNISPQVGSLQTKQKLSGWRIGFKQVKKRKSVRMVPLLRDMNKPRVFEQAGSSWWFCRFFELGSVGFWVHDHN